VWRVGRVRGMSGQGEGQRRASEVRPEKRARTQTQAQKGEPSSPTESSRVEYLEARLETAIEERNHYRKLYNAMRVIVRGQVEVINELQKDDPIPSPASTQRTPSPPDSGKHFYI